MIYRCIAPQWAIDEGLITRRVVEGEFTNEEIKQLNAQGYNIYFLPNYPSIYNPGTTVDGSQIDIFKYVFVDMDLKDGTYATKDDFLRQLGSFKLDPTMIVDSGNGIHVYWETTDLSPMTYLKLQRRLMRLFKTDEAVGQIYQLMRVPGTINTKVKDQFKHCEMIYETNSVYGAEEMDKALPPLEHRDLQYCEAHYNKTYNPVTMDSVSDKIPLKFAKLIRENEEVKDIWMGRTDDRSKGDYRLAHIMFACGFSKEEATSVLINSAKAISRAPTHRLSYATNIVEKIWIFETTEDKQSLGLSSSVADILKKSGSQLKGERFPCYSYIDATEHGFRLGQVIGLVAGSGVGKTAVALNMFMGFVQYNPDKVHFFVPLEQPANEIAERWQHLCGDQIHLHEKVHVISNYDETGNFRHLSFDEIKDYILKFQEVTGKKAGAVVIDHIGALKKKAKNGENQDLMEICHAMKAFAVQTNTLLIMQSQAPREKAGIGDLELNKDAAYGTVYFEAYCDYLVTLWQPLKRVYMEGAPTVTAFKFCKIRHKKQNVDTISEDVCYKLHFDPVKGHLRELTEKEEKSFTFFLNKATNKRKQDRKTDLVQYSSVTWLKESDYGKSTSNSN